MKRARIIPAYLVMLDQRFAKVDGVTNGKVAMKCDTAVTTQ